MLGLEGSAALLHANRTDLVLTTDFTKADKTVVLFTLGVSVARLSQPTAADGEVVFPQWKVL